MPLFLLRNQGGRLKGSLGLLHTKLRFRTLETSKSAVRGNSELRWLEGGRV